MSMPCARCSGEGSLYASRYGGNDPDVWPIGKCETCDGTGFVEREITDAGRAALQAQGDER